MTKTELFLKEASNKWNVKQGAKMSEHTTFKIGGIADVALFPKSADELRGAVTLAKDTGLPYYVVGRGSNLLVSDEGYRGVIIFTSDINGIEFEGTTVRAECGAGLTALSRAAGKRGLSGMECLCGIPGSVGGAVYMNAGAYGGEMKDITISSDYYSPTFGFGTLVGEEQDFSYRHSAYSGSDKIIISCTMKLNEGDPLEIQAKEEEHLKARRDKQPLEYPSAGSTFKRYPGRFTGKMIEDAGLKGFRVGGAFVSEKHAGFLVSDGSATASDMISLISAVREKVYEKEGVIIECEVKYLSPDGEGKI